MELESLQPEITKLECLSTSYTTLITTPHPVGGYRLGEDRQPYTQINLTKKPSFIHRFFTKLFLGWVWVDNKN
jgi:hypothetical protein